VTLKFGLGGFPEFLTPHTLDKGNIQLSRTPSVSELLSQSRSEIEESLNNFNSLDHVVFRLSGENPNELVQILRIYGLLGKFLNRVFSVSFWTMDSHHLGTQEAKASEYFDHVFVAHGQYLSLFDTAKSHYLPCSFSLASSADVEHYLADRNQQSSIISKGVCAPFAVYPWQRRNGEYADLLGEIRRLGIENAFFGTVRGGVQSNEALIHKILEHKVVLNLSLSDDLNMRNFEALALNRVLLTNKVRDHGIFAEWEDNIVYLDADSKSSTESLLESMKLTPKDISQNFLLQHGIEARVIKIVESLSGYSSDGTEFGFAGRSNFLTAGQTALNSTPRVEVPHTEVELLANSGFVPIRKVQALLEQSGNKCKTLWTFICFWCQSYGLHVVKTTIGRSSLVRAMLRMLV
jgi:hypothetical protein